MRTGTRRLWHRCATASERSARSCRKDRACTSRTADIQAQHPHRRGAHAAAWMAGLPHPAQTGFFQSWVTQIDAAALHYLQPRNPPWRSRHRPTVPLSFPSHGCTVLSCSRTRHRQPGSPAVTRCAQRAFSAGRRAARRPQTNQTDHLRDSGKEDAILILLKMQNKNHGIQIFMFISRFHRSGWF